MVNLTVESVRSLYESGLSAESVGKHFGCSRAWIRQFMKRNGINARPPGALPGSTKPEEQRKRMSLSAAARWAAWPADDDFRVKVSNSKFRHGIHNGYRKVYVPGRGRIFEHRLVVEQAIGRRLLDTEVVHHKDGNKLNNLIENLQITSSSEHGSIHHQDKPRTFRSATHKQCCKCRLVKPRSEFSPCTTKGRDPHTTRCKRCCADDKLARRIS